VQDRGRNPEVASPLPQDVDSSGKGGGTECTVIALVFLFAVDWRGSLPNDPAAVVRYASISRRVDRPDQDEGPLDFRRDSSVRLWHRLTAPPSVSPVPTEYRKCDSITRR